MSYPRGRCPPSDRSILQVAEELGDVKLASKCRINEAYNYIWLGQYGQAKRILLAQVKLDSFSAPLLRYFLRRLSRFMG